MTALHAVPAASPVRTRRADRAASTGPRNNAPDARRPREAVWAPVMAPVACADVAPERPVSFAEFAAGFAFVDAATGRSVDARHAADLDTVRVVRLKSGVAAEVAPVARVSAAPAVAAPARVEAAVPRYEWTPRGIAVLLALVALVVGVVGTTVVSAFLAVSPEPVSPVGQTLAAPLSVSVPGPGR